MGLKTARAIVEAINAADQLALDMLEPERKRALAAAIAKPYADALRSAHGKGWTERRYRTATCRLWPAHRALARLGALPAVSLH